MGNSSYNRRGFWHSGSRHRVREGVSSAFTRSHTLERMDSEPSVRCVHWLLYVANMESERRDVGLDSAQPLVCSEVPAGALCEPEQ